jgi:hypothetical protein
MIIKRFIAEIGAGLFGIFFLFASVGILAGTFGNIFWVPFFIGAMIAYVFARAWFYDVLEIQNKKS